MKKKLNIIRQIKNGSKLNITKVELLVKTNY